MWTRTINWAIKAIGGDWCVSLEFISRPQRFYSIKNNNCIYSLGLFFFGLSITKIEGKGSIENWVAIRIIKGEGSFEFHGALEGDQENLTVTHPKKKEKGIESRQ